jgi:RNA 2',3'-cyclic 3'-phosphodiesterase
MRLFVGIHLPDSVKRSAAGVAGHLRSRMLRAAPSASLRWIDPENLHLTLWFLGEVSESRADSLVKTFGTPFRVARFTLAFRGAGIFPETGPPRTVWLGLESGRESLLALHEQLGARLIPQGFEPERRAYSPHLTVARVKEAGRQDARALRAVVAKTVADAGECLADAVTLFRSRPSSQGSRYESVLRVPLE